MLKKRKKTKRIFVGSVAVGGGAPIAVQSMTKTDTRNTRATLRQIRALAREDCEIVRCAVPDMEAAVALGKIVKGSPLPVIADIHFDWRLALESLRQGVDGLRVNPGNLGARWKLKEVVAALKDTGVPVRVGVNAGSLEGDLLKKYGHPAPEALVESAARNIEALEAMGYSNLKVSLKASSVPLTVEAYRLFSKKYRYPLHVGISEAGPEFQGIIKSSVGLGTLLAEGIGDTVRVSLTAQPQKEVRTAWEILKSLGLREHGVNLISCPTCGRTCVDMGALVREAGRRLKHIKEPLTVAVMGCAVNGPGEAREADFGIASGHGEGLVFKKGKVVARVPEGKLIERLMKEIGE